MNEDPSIGDIVAFMWGIAEVHGTVSEGYGQPGNRQVVITLDPATSVYVVDEPTTVSLPINDVRRIVTA